MQMNRYRKVLAYSAAILCVSAQAGAQSISLTDALETAVRNYPAVKASQAAAYAAKEEREAAANLYIPRLALQHQYTYGTSNNVVGAFYPNGGTVLSPSGGVRPENIYEGTFGSYTSGLLEWDFINFGKISSETKAAQANADAAQAALENEIFQHQVRVADAYLQLLIVEKLAGVQRKNVERALQFKLSIDAAVLSGLRPAVDSSLAKTEYLKAQLLLIDSERLVESQSNRLGQLLGAAPGGGVLKADSMRFFTALPEFAEPEAPANAHPLLSVFEAQIEAANNRGQAIKRSYLPSISLTAAGWARGSGISNVDESYRTDFNSGASYQVYNYMFGLSTRWTITDFSRINNRYQAQRYLATRQTEIYNEQALELERQKQDARIQYQYMKAQADFAPLQLEAARTAYSQTQARYESGLTDLPTYMQSLVALTRAESELAITYSNTWRSLLLLAASTGDLNLFLDQLTR